MEQSISVHESRLRRVYIVIDDPKPFERALRFRVDALVQVEPARVPVRGAAIEHATRSDQREACSGAPVRPGTGSGARRPLRWRCDDTARSFAWVRARRGSESDAPTHAGPVRPAAAGGAAATLRMGGPIAVGALELQHDFASWIVLEPFVGNRRASDIAPRAFELPALSPLARAIC